MTLSLRARLMKAIEFDRHRAEVASNTSEGRWLSAEGIAEVDGAEKENARLRPILEALAELSLIAIAEFEDEALGVGVSNEMVIAIDRLEALLGDEHE